VSAPTFDLGTLHGGLRLPILKDESTARVIQHVPVPMQLVLPLAQHAGEPAHPVVTIGERVLKGQLIADADGTISAPVHASSSGKVVAIEQWPVSRRLGENAPCIVIECDGLDNAVQLSEPIVPFEQHSFRKYSMAASSASAALCFQPRKNSWKQQQSRWNTS